MQKFCVFIVLCVFANLASAQQLTVSGTIKDSNGAPIPFASVYIKNTTVGTSANVDGHYTIRTPKGTNTLIYRAVGYKQLEKEFASDGNTVINVVLPDESYTLNNVTIKANAEDPAYEIMRKVISMRKKHLEEVNAFSCDVYIKGVQRLNGAPKKFFGRDIQKILELDTNRRGIIYLSESESRFNFKRPNDVREEMLSSKVAGRNNAFSFNKASDLIINFYENHLLEGTISTRGFVSPLSDNAMLYYKYKFLGETRENGETINKIQVIPRRENDPVFRGIIYITDDSWRLYNTDLYLVKNAGVNLIDTLNISQQFTKIQDVYMPTAINFQFNGKVLGFKFAGYYIGVYSNYNLSPNFPKNFFNGEILKVTELVNKKDSIYWKNNRPIPLTPDERLNYIKKDSIAKLKESKHYLDSVERENNKFGIGKFLLTGYSINNRFDKEYYYFDPIIQSVFYNTVEGFAVKYGVTYRKVFDNNRSYSIRPEIRYGFANKTFTGTLSGSYQYNVINRAVVGGSLGSGIFDLNNYGSMPLWGNSINSLLYEKNFSKFYQKNFVNAYTSRELINGLQGTLTVNFSRNKTLVNHSSFKIRDVKDLEFTSNNPFTPAFESPLFPDYNALSASLNLTYSINQKYITRPDGRFYEESSYPKIVFAYRKGIKNVLSSAVDYDFVRAEIYQEKISAGLWGFSSFSIGAGKFLNNKSLYYPDYKHFQGNIALIFPPDMRKFQFLDFYQFSTKRQYFEAHAEHNFAGFFTNKVPLLRKLKLEEFVGGGYLSSPEKRNYTEFYFGLQRLIFRVGYGYAYDGNKKVSQGFRISYGF